MIQHLFDPNPVFVLPAADITVRFAFPGHPDHVRCQDTVLRQQRQKQFQIQRCDTITAVDSTDPRLLFIPDQQAMSPTERSLEVFL